MKKLFMSALIATVAVVANAATVNWQSTAIYVPVESTTPSTYLKANGGTRVVNAYVFEYAASDSATWQAYKDGTKDIWADYSAGKLTGTQTSGKTSATGTATIAGSMNYGETDYGYGLVIYTFDKDGDSKVDYYYTSAEKTSSEVGTGLSVSGILVTSSTNVGAWVATPEPTSGLLLLLGMAGLALKRKRA